MDSAVEAGPCSRFRYRIRPRGASVGVVTDCEALRFSLPAREQAFLTVALSEDGKIREERVEVISPLTDFSLIFRICG